MNVVVLFFRGDNSGWWLVMDAPSKNGAPSVMKEIPHRLSGKLVNCSISQSLSDISFDITKDTAKTDFFLFLRRFSYRYSCINMVHFLGGWRGRSLERKFAAFSRNFLYSSK